MQVQDIMSHNVVYCVTATSLPSLAKMMIENDCGAIPVVDNNTSLRPVGMVTDRDIVCRAVSKGYYLADLTAADCMTSPAITITPETRLADLCRLMAAQQVRRVIVVDASGACQGIVSVADLARHGLQKEIALVLEHVSQPLALQSRGA